MCYVSALHICSQTHLSTPLISNEAPGHRQVRDLVVTSERSHSGLELTLIASCARLSRHRTRDFSVQQPYHPCGCSELTLTDFAVELLALESFEAT